MIVNRTLKPLDVMFDGVPEVIPAGYRVVTATQKVPKRNAEGKALKAADTGEPLYEDKPVEKVIGAAHDGAPLTYPVEYAAAEAYIRQHPIMGTADPNSIDARDTQYLLGVEAWGHDVSHVEQSDAIELIDRSMLPDDRQVIEVRNIAGKRRDVSRAAITDRKISENKRRAALDAGDNPNGIRLS